MRPILYRASLVEMAVPYAEPRAPYNRKCAFDVGACTRSHPCQQVWEPNI